MGVRHGVSWPNAAEPSGQQGCPPPFPARPSAYNPVNIEADTIARPTGDQPLRVAGDGPTVGDRVRGEVGEQATMFLVDPSGNALEFKSFQDPRRVFAT